MVYVLKSLTNTRTARPSIVTAASCMLGVGGALFAGEVSLSADSYFTGMRTYEQAVHDGIVGNDTAFAAVGVAIHVVPAVIGIFAGAALVVLALFTAFGQGWARAISWVFGLPILLWYGVLAVLRYVAGAISGSVEDPDPAELARRYEQAWPEWRNTLDAGLMVAVAALLITALVCQTVPAADAYFRRRRVNQA
jgi:hypothetical protein